ncbi:hypothetical protein F2Q70_00035701 [Brassica cretica]|uniref:Uncharacterized protein n=1 Tax=Brassica cretica TaxID=69181 RepID=A0A8S9JRY8_BRACR|nr:hypothetical protein F2Q70_00035701 [Brassica cretica]
MNLETTYEAKATSQTGIFCQVYSENKFIILVIAGGVFLVGGIPFLCFFDNVFKPVFQTRRR